MAFIFADGFEGYTAASDLADRGWVTGNTPTIATSTVKDGSNSLNLDSNESAAQVAVCEADYGFLAFWFRYSYTADGATVCRFLRNAGGSEGVHLHLDTGGTLSVQNFDSSTLGTGVAVLAENTWYHIQMKAIHTNTTGTNDIIVKVDDVEDINVTAGADTQSSTDNKVHGFSLRSGGALSSEDHFFDSVVFWTGDAGDEWNDFRGILRMETLRPTGVGNSSDFLGQDADSTNNFEQIDEAGAHDGDASYIESLTVGHKDLSSYGNITAGDISQIVGVQLVTVAEKTDTGDRRIKPLARPTSTDYQGAENVLTNASYVGFAEMWDQDPQTAVDWTESGVNAAEFGVEVTT